MSFEKVLKNIPQESFLKVQVKKNRNISSSDKAQLVRKANELYNNSRFKDAEKIYIALGYSDGLSRIGDRYQKKGEFFNALKFYQLAAADAKIEVICVKMADVLKKWLS